LGSALIFSISIGDSLLHSAFVIAVEFASDSSLLNFRAIGRIAADTGFGNSTMVLLSLTPTFSSTQYTYGVTVPADVESIIFSAQTVSSACTSKFLIGEQETTVYSNITENTRGVKISGVCGMVSTSYFVNITAIGE
jgi:hypothetical protein